MQSLCAKPKTKRKEKCAVLIGLNFLHLLGCSLFQLTDLYEKKFISLCFWLGSTLAMVSKKAGFNLERIP
jgi:hypothetical protein